MLDKRMNYYKKVLHSHKKLVNFFDISEEMFNNALRNIYADEFILYSRTVLVTAPVLISYVLFLIEDAKKKNIKRLYFLSRDGYIMHKIATIVCESYKIDIECRYLYVSRLALRSPLYLIDKNEAISRFFEDSKKFTVDIILKRMQINDENILQQINEKVDLGLLNKALSKDEINKVRKILFTEISGINDVLIRNSKDNYNKIIRYFSQEGLFDGINYAIVDTGWMGSMQHYFNQILSYANANKIMNGYYFGIFDDGYKAEGMYNCFYFAPNKNQNRRILFNNNLFECMCSANHGMTIGYDYINDGEIIPKTKEYRKVWNVDLQINTIVEFTKVFVCKNKYSDVKITGIDKMVEKLLVKLMIFPTKEEAAAYGKIPFCDDVTENYMEKLAENLSDKDLSMYNVLYKIMMKLLHKNTTGKKSFWINGTIQLSNIVFKSLFNINCILSEYIHYFLQHRK